jgi:hypothetical protein
MMTDEAQLREKLRKIEALFAGASTELWRRLGDEVDQAAW